jgi:hypothetical protein
MVIQMRSAEQSQNTNWLCAEKQSLLSLGVSYSGIRIGWAKEESKHNGMQLIRSTALGQPNIVL